MTHYQVGRRFEYEVKKDLEGKGFVVFRVAGSKGLFDLIAIKDGHLDLIQCKYNVNISKQELNKIYEFLDSIQHSWLLVNVFIATKKKYSKEIEYAPVFPRKVVNLIEKVDIDDRNTRKSHNRDTAQSL